MKWPALFALVAFVPAAKPTPPVYTSLIFGTCTAQSFGAVPGAGGDAALRKQPLHCDRVTVDFLDRQYKRMRLTFSTTIGPNPASELAFTGVRDLRDQVVDVIGFTFNGPPGLPVTSGTCRLSFARRTIKSIVCRADNTADMKYSILVAFEASPGQSLGDDNDQPE